MNAADAAALTLEADDLERRFGGLRRLYGEAGYERLRTAHVAVVGLGGVGSWAVEALARSGVARLTLIDLDHVAESNINRQIQALGTSLGKAKTRALAERVADIHPGCVVEQIEEFVDETNWPALIGARRLDGLIDACDQVRAKAALAAWAVRTGTAFVGSGAAGGKQQAQAVELDDLSCVTHDPLLASVRQRLRKEYGAPRNGTMNVACVFSREPVKTPQEACRIDGSLNCHGYGSSVAVTATFGMVAAGEMLRRLSMQRRETVV